MRSNLKNQIVLVKDGERYLFLFDEASQKTVLRVFGKFASDPQLNFSWYDAAVLARKVRTLAGAVPGRSARLCRDSQGSLPGRDHE